MAKVVTIPWNEGMGSITATYEGSGNGPITLTSEANTGIDRAQEITVTTDNGLASEKVLVSQEGLRQPFGLMGGGVFRLANGGRFGVLRGQPNMPTKPTMGVSIVTQEGFFIPYGEWADNGTPIGVCVKDDRIGAIILDLEQKNVKWTDSSVNISGIPMSTSESALIDYMDGLQYTALMLGKNPSDTYAAGYATSRKITINSVEYIGYVASLAEWSVLMEYDDAIASAFTAIGEGFIGTSTSRNFWTSVQNNSSKAWRFAFNANGGFTRFSSYSKISYSYVKAVYKYE